MNKVVFCLVPPFWNDTIHLRTFIHLTARGDVLILQKTGSTTENNAFFFWVLFFRILVPKALNKLVCLFEVYQHYIFQAKCEALKTVKLQS